MSTLIYKNMMIESVRFSKEMFYFQLQDGREIGAPLKWFPLLENGTPEQRNHWRLICGGTGIHWPDLDEDISLEGLLAGNTE